MVNQNLILTWKLFCFGSSIISGYAAIVNFKERPIFGVMVMYYVIFFDCSKIYTRLYEKGFKVPALLGKTQTLLMLRVNRGVRKADWELLKRQLISVPELGIKVVQFHALERNSTPVFLHSPDECCQHTCSLSVNK